MSLYFNEVAQWICYFERESFRYYCGYAKSETFQKTATERNEKEKYYFFNRCDEKPIINLNTINELFLHLSWKESRKQRH